jgi:3-oxoacyl-(acyl-carrier-protein) synthase
VAGFGTSCNAFHMTDLPADGTAMAACIRLALKDADLRPDEIHYINAHGSSTRMNDIFETNAYKMVFGDYAYKLPISSMKSMIGHIGAMIFEKNLLPPTINQVKNDPLCDLDYIPNCCREKKVDSILKTSSGFSGIHSSLIITRYKN